MSKILIPSSGPNEWQRFLAKPDLQWKRGYSARTLAHSWEAAKGIPHEVAEIMTSAFGKPELLFAVPEHKTSLPGGKRESQSDILALVKHNAGLATYAIEGKVEEPFGELVGEWRAKPSSGRAERFSFLSSTLGITDCPPDIRYQLLHRTASALIEAERFGAPLAGMLVHSFSPELRWLDDFKRFVEMMSGTMIAPGEAVTVTAPNGSSLVLGWACGDEGFLRS
jgi:hypothetical protein